jgi:ligand-binding sensor domain-containing protein/AraC-like DNA-binding protein/DNA-binding NarL/FixJ family response regulator
MKKFRILTLLMLALPMAAVALYLFKTLDATNGLTSSQINCILKDGKGYVWFGTPAGLYRYDGYVFKIFQCNSKDGASLPDSYITSIQEALDGTLWINTSAGYCIYHPQSETFERDMKQAFARMGIERVPSVIYIDKYKNIWGAIPNKGVLCYNMQQQLLYEFGYTDDDTGVPQGNVCSISECKDGAIIVYDDGRIVCCDVMHQQHTVWRSSDIATRKLRKTTSLKAFADQLDNIWLYGQGTLFMYDKNSKEWNTTIGDQLGLTSISVDNSVNGMGSDDEGNVWIGTDRAGLIRMDVKTHVMEVAESRNMHTGQQNPAGLKVQSIYVDDTGLLWIGTEKSGVAYYGKNIYRFYSSQEGDITAMTQDAGGRIWYGTSSNGIIGYDGQLSSQKVTAMQYTKDGSLWVGSRQNGLTRIKDGVTTIYSAAIDDGKTLIDDHINALCTDKVGNLWIATNGGLQVYNPKMNTFSSYTRENGKLTTNNITTLFYTHDNHMLIGTNEGVIFLNLSTTEMKVLTGNSSNLKPFTNNYITQLYEDTRGLIWIGTREGINVLNPETDDLSHITENEGLCNNNICGITEDERHNIWVSTSNGVSRVVIQRNSDDGSIGYGTYNYDTSDGLLANEFNPGAILTAANGDILFGSIYGTNWTRHDIKEDKEALPRVMLTQLFIGEEEILIGHVYEGNVILPQALNETNHLELDNDQNTITVKFSAGNYNQSERLQFKYWLEGRDMNWRNGDAMTHGVTFDNLESGTYTLHVKAVSAEGAVSNQERILEIIVHRPWYMAWWMMLIYAIVIIGVLYMWKIGITQLKEVKKKKEAVISDLKLQREEIKMASDDLRQPMARMTSIIGNLVEKETALEEREQLNALHSQMLQIITRVADMQSALEHPEETAKTNVNNRYELNSKGELTLPTLDTDSSMPSLSTTSLQRRRADSPTSKLVVFFIDDNEELLKFATSKLYNVYDFHVYNSTRKAADDLKNIKADLVVCKQEMHGMTGSELCNMLKTNADTQKVKFILMTDTTLTQHDIATMGITMAADDYLPKPFNMQDAVKRFNTLLGLGAVLSLDSGLIEGAETRRLESQNSSMTTASENMGAAASATVPDGSPIEASDDDEMKIVETTLQSKNALLRQNNALANVISDEPSESLMGDFSMADAMDQQLLKNIEQYVLQNMSRGQISLEEMANVMGMGRVPFFHKVRNLTGKTPAELVRDLRLKHVCILLKRTNINMSELATNVGFMTAENLIKVFKEKFGLSPLEYRLKHRQ